MRTAIAVLAVAAAFGAGAVMAQSAAKMAVAELKPISGSQTAGKVTFTQTAGKLRVEASITGLTPGAHGIHIHDKGDCSAADGSSAGGHFNPHGKTHGDRSGTERHAGDMGNLSAAADGAAKLDAEIEGLALGGGAADIVGRSVIVHADPDDLKSQPAGNSGKRIACGVILAK